MAGQLIPRGKGAWLVCVYLGTDPDTGNLTAGADKRTIGSSALLP